ncbi:MAG: DUF4260 domain-containing protein [Chloroflexi bacterium]|nr:DUF4260 domain-containing protein [Chloroflexota bacterium]
MKRLIQLEEVALTFLCLWLFVWGMGYDWWWYIIWFLAPDLSMLGYLLGATCGALTYNFVHHKGVAVALFAAGAILVMSDVQAAALILLGHSSLDRAVGYGLKHMDSFRHTHLGWIGKERA